MNPADLAVAFAPHLGLEASSLGFLRYSQNFVFGYREDAVERILRITSDGEAADSCPRIKSRAYDRVPKVTRPLAAMASTTGTAKNT